MADLLGLVAEADRWQTCRAWLLRLTGGRLAGLSC